MAPQRAALVASLTSLIVFPFAALTAQRVTTSLDLGGTSVRYADSLSATGPSVRPSVSVEWPHAVAGVAGSYSHYASASSGDGVVYGSLFTRPAGPFVGELGAVAGGSVHESGGRTGQATATARLHLMTSRMGAWFGSGAGQSSDGAKRRAIRLQELGAWIGLSQGSLVASATPASLGDTIEYTDVQLAARHHTPSLDADLSFGFRTGDDLPSIGGTARQWGSAALSVWIHRDAALVMAVGAYPADFAQGFPGGRFVALGIRMATNRAKPPDRDARRPSTSTDEEPSFSVASRGEEREFHVRAARARTVEIAGDFSAWRPMSLVRGDDGTWLATLPISAGAYQMNVRFDGGPWMLPAGLPVVHDEFGGSAGLLVLQ